MIRRMIFLAVGLSLLPGCGRRDHPTVRQSFTNPKDAIAANTAPNPPEEDATCPGTATPPTRPTRDPERRVKLAEAARSKSADVSLATIAATDPAKTGDSKRVKAADRDSAELGSKEVRFGGVCLVAPENWTRQRPPIDFILAYFSLPRASGDRSDAQLTVASAGATDPGSLARLREQLKQESEAGVVEQLKIAGNEVILVDSLEDDSDAGDASGSSVSEGRYRLLNAVVFVGRKAYFVNCTGPEKTVGERAGEFRAFLQTMKTAE